MEMSVGVGTKGVGELGIFLGRLGVVRKIPTKPLLLLKFSITLRIIFLALVGLRSMTWLAMLLSNTQ